MSPPPIERPHQLKIWLAEEERDGLQALADDAGLTVSDYVRQWIRRELSERPKKRR